MLKSLLDEEVTFGEVDLGPYVWSAFYDRLLVPAHGAKVESVS